MIDHIEALNAGRIINRRNIDEALVKRVRMIAQSCECCDNHVACHHHIDLAIGLADVERERTQSLACSLRRSRGCGRCIGRNVRLNTHLNL